MNKKYILTILLALGVFINPAIAQPPPPGCPPSNSAGFDIDGDSVSVCNDGVNLTVTGFSTLNSTDSYGVNPIPYIPYPWIGTNAVIVGQDDIWSGVVNIPFDFCFFGQKYNQLVIGANGQVGFDITQAGLGNAWAIGGAAPAANAAMNNTIMAPYHDLDPSIGTTSQITWDIYGTAPCRYLVVSWDSVPMFSCTSLFGSQQVVLFESTYLVDINIRNKPLCSTWNGGLAIEGLQNATGTTAFIVPGRNATQWSATNDSYRFTPAGTNIQYLYTWIDVPTNTVLGTGPTLSYIPPANTQVTVTCQAITDCDTINAAVADTIDIIVTGLVEANFDYEVRLGCDADTIIFTNTSVNGTTGNISYFWDFGDASFSSQTNPTHIYGAQNVYNVTLTATANGCTDDTTISINLNHPIDASFASNPPNDSICLGQQMQWTNTSTATGPQPAFFLFDNFWDFGDGTSGTNNSPFVTHTYTNPGSYTVTLTITDTLGCQDSISTVVFVDEPAFAQMSATPTQICVGEPVYFTDTVAPHTVFTRYDFGDGNILDNLHNPKHTYDQAGVYNATFTAFYAVCPDSTITEVITVDDYPLVNLGDDQEICPDLTQAITLNNIDNPSQILNWSDGTQGASISVSKAGYYWAEASNGACSSTDSIWIKRDCYLNIPNSFSPNNDGLNDYFFPRQLLSAGLTDFSMKIFNRWGELIFETTNINGRGWDGRYGGKEQPTGVFVYLIEAEWRNGFKNKFQGNVTLLR